MTVSLFVPQGLTYEVIERPVEPPPPPPSGGDKRPVLGTSHFHQQQNWMADWVSADVANGRALPWTLGEDLPNGIIARGKGGVAPTRVYGFHLWGNPTELYSEIPWFDPQGRSHPYSPQHSDDISLQAEDFADRPPTAGARGLCMPISQITAIPHPTMFPPADASMVKTPNTGVIPRHPLWIALRHDALLELWYADGRVRHLGKIPTIGRCSDACIDGRFLAGTLLPDGTSVRKIMYVADMGTKVGAVWSGGRIVRVDRTPGSEAVGGTPQENPSAYTVTTIATAGYPTAVRSDETGAVYFIDGDRGGQITKIAADGGATTTLCTIPEAFAMDYANGKLYVISTSAVTHIVNAATGVTEQTLFPPSGVFQASTRDADFFTISVDANGTFGPVGTICCSRVHTRGNINTWQYAPDFSMRDGHQIYGSGQGWNSCGDIRWMHEPFGHYDWLGGKYHIDQGIRLVGGYANVPVAMLVADPPYPAQAGVDYTAIWRGMQIICQGGAVLDKSRPSLTCLMSREGWSMFPGCSNDEIAEMGFDAAEAWIQGGYAGSFPRPDIVGVDLYCVMLLHLVNSQRHIREGAALISAFNSWFAAKYPAVTIPYPVTTIQPKWVDDGASAHRDGNGIDYRLEVRETGPGSYRIGIFGSASADVRYSTQGEYTNNPTIGPVPADAVIVVDEGMPSETTLPATLAPGWHAFTVRAAGWSTGAVTYQV